MEISTAGTVILKEFQKYPRMPSHWTPVQASDQALLQPRVVHSLGRAIRLPVRMSMGVLKLVISMMNSGIRYTSAARISTA